MARRYVRYASRSPVFGAALILSGIVMLGCGWDIGEVAPKATERVFQDGRVYALNNLRPRGIDAPRVFFVVHDGQRFDVPHNMTFDGEPTLAGAVLLSPDPLPGGTPLDLEYWAEQGGDVKPRVLSDFWNGPVIVDGDMTIEFYYETWEYVGWDYSHIIPKIVHGKFEGAHAYEE